MTQRSRPPLPGIRSGIGALAMLMILQMPAGAEVAGGSNYGWFDINGCRARVAIAEVDREERIVRAQLQAIYDAGQRRLRLPFFFQHAVVQDTSTITKEGIAPGDRAKIATLLRLVREIGFEEVIFAIMSQADSFATNWTVWREDLYLENWRAIQQVRDLLLKSGLTYRIDLLNEGIPAAGDPMLLKYTQRLWRDYTAAHGVDDTVGFSVIPEDARIANIPKVYGGTSPTVLDVHLYDKGGARLRAVKRQLDALGFGSLPWIVGETFYDDPDGIADIRRAAVETGVSLLYILQWPLSRNQACQHVDVIPTKPVPGALLPSERQR